MLKQLNIRDFAIIDEIEIAFYSGMTVFTGETGAGKSILIDALGLVLGDRAETTAIRDKSERAEISATFDIRSIDTVKKLLDDQAIESEDEELIIRRVISRDGRSRAYINNCPASAQLLRHIGQYLIGIHGQHAHQSLMQMDMQRELVDGFGKYEKDLKEVQNLYNSWNEHTAKLEKLQTNDKGRNASLSLLRYQVDELASLQQLEDEYENLDAEHRRLSNTSRIQKAVQMALNTIDEDEFSISSRLNKIQCDLLEMQKYDDSLNSTVKILDEASIQIDEAGSELRNYLNTMELSPEHLQEVEQRLSDLHAMARKHQIQPAQLTEHLTNLEKQLNELENNKQFAEELTKKQQQALESYRKVSDKLHNSRVKTAKLLSTAITEKLWELGMPHGRLSISVENDDRQVPKPTGNDQIEILVNTNPGQTLQPLRKVASGGELSRISLATQVIASKNKGVPSMIFDEVDAGIGGGIAEIVGKLLNELASQHQVLCVTHLPQVASQGKHHLQVCKESSKTSTVTSVIQLEEKQRVDEIARMLGGLKLTEQSRQHADEMLSYSN